jgi:hypothetical protein
MKTNGYFPKMQLEVAKGQRICQLCENFIEKGQKCYTVRVRNGMYARGLHIHKKHIRPWKVEECNYKMECMTGEHTRKCHVYNCPCHYYGLKQIGVQL